MASFPSSPEEMQSMAEELRATSSYQNRDAYQWYGILYNGMLKERRDEPGAAEMLKELTGLSKDQYEEHERARFIAALVRFKETGEGYDDKLGRQFPIFDGEAPEGHPYPGAFSGSGAADRSPVRV
tara:strand:+ start:1016 stop:1393 length:378 start_codon:yes stop_codon:yes gene_type:complete